MADDKTKVGGQDRSRININEDYEVRDWCKSLLARRTGMRSIHCVIDHPVAYRPNVEHALT